MSFIGFNLISSEPVSPSQGEPVSYQIDSCKEQIQARMGRKERSLTNRILQVAMALFVMLTMASAAFAQTNDNSNVNSATNSVAVTLSDGTVVNDNTLPSGAVLAGGPTDGLEVQVWMNARPIRWLSADHKTYEVTGMWLERGANGRQYVKPGQSFVVEGWLMGKDMNRVGKVQVDAFARGANSVVMTEPAHNTFTALKTGKIRVGTLIQSVNQYVEFNRYRFDTIECSFLPAPVLGLRIFQPEHLPTTGTTTVKVQIDTNVPLDNVNFKLSHVGDLLRVDMNTKQGWCWIGTGLSGCGFNLINGSATLTEWGPTGKRVIPLSDDFMDFPGVNIPFRLWPGLQYCYMLQFDVEMKDFGKG